MRREKNLIEIFRNLVLPRKFILVTSFCAFFSLSLAQHHSIPYNSDSTFYRIDLALGNPERCHYLFLEKDTLEELPDISKLKNLKGITFRYCLNLHWEDAIRKLAQLSNLRYLEISICDLKSIPENISDLKQVESLNFKSNMLTSVHSGINQCQHLRYLDLSFNNGLDWEATFEILKSHPSLQALDISSNSISRLPENFTSLNNLIEVNLSNNRLATLPGDLGSLQSLEALDLSHNIFLDYEKELEKVTTLANLKRLTLASNNLSELPEVAGNLSKLEALDLTDNRLKSLPSSIERLINLKELRLGMGTGQQRNRITSFPRGFDQLVNLEVLDLSGDSIITIPPAIARFKRLKKLDLSWCTIFDISPAIRELKVLEVLDLSHNHINKIPEWIGELSSLKEIHVDGDFFAFPVDKISIIPPTIGNLKELEVLSLRDQVIRALPASISGCGQLRILDLRNNLITSLPDEIFNLHSLEVLGLKANELKVLPEGFYKLSNLRDLDISFNESLDMIQAAQQIQQMNQLQVLDISFNNLRPQIYYELRERLPKTQIVAKGFNNLVPIESNK